MRASRWRRSLVAVATAGLLGFGTSGCTSDDDPPRPAPLPTEPPSPSQSASPSAPLLPSEAQGTSGSAAKAFARHWVDTVNYAMASGDASPLEALASSACSTCTNLASRIERVNEAGGRFEGGQWTIRALRYTRLPERAAYVVAGVNIDEQTVTERRGAEPVRNEATRGSLEFRMRPADNSWSIYELVAR